MPESASIAAELGRAPPSAANAQNRERLQGNCGSSRAQVPIAGEIVQRKGATSRASRRDGVGRKLSAFAVVLGGVICGWPNFKPNQKNGINYTHKLYAVSRSCQVDLMKRKLDPALYGRGRVPEGKEETLGCALRRQGKEVKLHQRTFSHIRSLDGLRVENLTPDQAFRHSVLAARPCLVGLLP